MALRITDVGKRFGPTVALDGATFEVAAGEVHALIGENGAGKTTLLNVLGGLLRPDRGSIEVEGRPYAPASPREARERGIALIHQELSLFPHLTVAENVLVGAEPRRRGFLDRAGGAPADAGGPGRVRARGHRPRCAGWAACPSPRGRSSRSAAPWPRGPGWS